MNKSKRNFLCRLDELPDPGSKGGMALLGDSDRDIFIVHRDGNVYGYINSCPHTGGPLDWMPDQFLSLDKLHIQCATHDALFRLDDGVCVAGPCAGDHLTAVPIEVESGNVYVLSEGPEGPEK